MFIFLINFVFTVCPIIVPSGVISIVYSCSLNDSNFIYFCLFSPLFFQLINDAIKISLSLTNEKKLKQKPIKRICMEQKQQKPFDCEHRTKKRRNHIICEIIVAFTPQYVDCSLVCFVQYIRYFSPPKY